MADLNLILLGPPGSGKGTQGERLQEDLDLPYYATGDILRAAVKEGTDAGVKAKEYMDRGDRVPGAHRSLVQGERRGRVLSHPVTRSVGVAQQSKQARICVRCRLDLRQRPECLRVESPLVERHHRVVVRRRCPCRAPERE